MDGSKDVKSMVTGFANDKIPLLDHPIASSDAKAHCKLTIEEVQKLQVRVLFSILLRLIIVHRVKRRQVQVSKLVEIEELGVGEKRQFGIEVERILLLLLLLHSLVIRRGDRVQVIEVLGEVGGATAVVFGHGG